MPADTVTAGAQIQQSQPASSPTGSSAPVAPATDLGHAHAPAGDDNSNSHGSDSNSTAPAGHNNRRQQPRDLTGVLAQLTDNAQAIAAAEGVLSGLVAHQASLHQIGRKLEQQQVLAVLHQGHLGFNKGRPVAAVLVYRCLHRWGLLLQTEPCPFLEQLSSLLQSQLDLDDASAPAEVAGLQCHVANSLTLCAVLYCVLLKASHPELAAAAAAERHRVPKQLHSAAEVVAAARKKMSATWQQGVAHMGPGLQALSKLKIGGWGFKRSVDAGAAGTPPAAGTPSAAAAAESGSSTTGAAEQQEHMQASTELTHSQTAAPATGAPADAASSAAAAAAVTAESLHQAAPLGAFMLCLDHLVQHAYILLRDQLKRRLTPLLGDCISPDDDSMLSGPAAGSAAAEGGDSATAVAAAPAGASQEGEDGGQQPQSPAAAAGTAVAGSAAESAAHAEAALMNFRSWSELVGVLHAALVALRAAHVPRALRAALMQQVLEFVDCQLFNQLLLRPECCSVSNARYALRGLKQLDTWIIAELSAAHQQEHGRGSDRRHAAGVAGTGSIHSGSFNSQASPAGADGPSASKGGDSSSSTAVGAQPSSPAARAAAGSDSSNSTGAVAAEEDDGGWEQVPADTGEFDAWQPAKQQQQQQHWWRPHKQQQATAGGPAEQPELGPEAWDALSHVRQALQFLVFDSKGDLSLEDLTEHVCPALNHQQLYRLCTTAWSDAPDTTDDAAAAAGGVSGEVLEQMKQLYTLSSNGGLIVTFLLDEPSGPLPFVQPPPAAAGTAAATGSSSAGGAARCKPSAVVCWDDGRDYGAGLRPVPAVLTDEGCPAEVFEFMATDQPWPPGRHGA